MAFKVTYPIISLSSYQTHHEPHSKLTGLSTLTLVDGAKERSRDLSDGVSVFVNTNKNKNLRVDYFPYRTVLPFSDEQDHRIYHSKLANQLVRIIPSHLSSLFLSNQVTKSMAEQLVNLESLMVVDPQGGSQIQTTQLSAF